MKLYVVASIFEMILSQAKTRDCKKAAPTFPIRKIPYFGVPVGYISAFIVIVDMRAEFSVKRYLNIKVWV